MKKAVFITGASTGIGNQLALDLAKQGYLVFAGVRSQKDSEQLAKSAPQITPLLADVTKPLQILDAFKEITKQGPFDEFNLINNAGVGYSAPIELSDLPEVKKLFDVNFFGVLLVTQTFLPFMRTLPGKIINISSVSGRTAYPFLSAYSSSKHALEAFSDSLRWELLGTQIKVVVVEPGPVHTPIWNKGLAAKDNLTLSLLSSTNHYYQKPVGLFAKLVAQSAKNGISTTQVSHTIIKILNKKRPPARILVCSFKSRIEVTLLAMLPSVLVDFTIKSIFFNSNKYK